MVCLLGAYSGGYLGRRTEETASSLDVDLFSVDCTMGSVDRFGFYFLVTLIV